MDWLQKKKNRKILASLIAAIILAVYTSFQEPRPESNPDILSGQSGFYLVTEVVDGDTFKISVNGESETVRLVGIDSPETKDPGKPKECYGEESSQKLSELILNKQVRLEKDTKQPDRDRYKRLLRYVYMEDGVDVNALLLKEGFATVYETSAFGLYDEYKVYEAEAVISNRGLWGACKISQQ